MAWYEGSFEASLSSYFNNTGQLPLSYSAPSCPTPTSAHVQFKN